MDDKELELRKEEQRQKIREIGQNAQLKSLESQLKTEKEANKHFEEIERTLKEMKKVVDSWDRKYENTPEKRRTEFHVIKETDVNQL
ncbi:hypothetical protein BCR22_05525 [Enterococcus plantarum]|uniref:hypothetical protein n=1 Tax=Enterococcus plantarum TaxID=1077675 RepID=UPI00084D2AE5|nr:hypothetical protein [Enterococcus plantarum]OEG11183.1 hypothetical protein BCR22_05525 [Enterococcus plantarum]